MLTSRRSIRKRAIAVAGAAALWVLHVGTAAAATLASGFILSSSALLLECTVSNVSDRPVEITSASVIDLDGNEVTDFSLCGTLQPRETCAFNASGNNGRGVVQLTGSAKSVRGTCYLVAAGNDLIEATDLR